MERTYLNLRLHGQYNYMILRVGFSNLMRLFWTRYRVIFNAQVKLCQFQAKQLSEQTALVKELGIVFSKCRNDAIFRMIIGMYMNEDARQRSKMAKHSKND